MAKATVVSKEVYSLATYQDVETLLGKQSIKDRIAKLVPTHLKPDRLTRVVLNAWTRTPELRQCTPASFVLAVLEAAALGLEPDGLLGQGWIIPFKKSARFIPGYRGLMQLGYRTGEITSWKPVIVHSNDKYRYQEGLHPILEHEVTSATDEGDVVAAYSVIQYKDGAVDFEWMWKKDLEKIRKKSQYPDGGPWRDHTEEMYKKTVIRRHSKRARLSIEDLSRAANLDEARELDSGATETFLPGDLVADLLEGDLAFTTTTEKDSGSGSGPAKETKVTFEETIPEWADLSMVPKFLDLCVSQNPGYTVDLVRAEAVEMQEQFWKDFKGFVQEQKMLFDEESGKQEPPPQEPLGGSHISMLHTPPQGTPAKKGKPVWRTKNSAGEDAVVCKPRGGKAMSPAICEACSAGCEEFKAYKKFVEMGKV